MSIEKNPVTEKLLGPVAQLLEFKKYIETRKAVKDGDNLFDYDSDELVRKGLLEPWPFNIQESVYATAPTLVLIKILDFLFGESELINDDLEKLPEYERAFATLFGDVYGFFNTFTVPVLTTAIVFLIGWGVLRRQETNKDRRRRSRRAYLYYDGAYGLVAQSILVLSVSLFSWGMVRPSLVEKLPYLMPVVGVLFVLSSLMLFYLIAKKIPKLLFASNGYSNRVKHLWSRSQPKDPPWSKYTLAVFLGGWPLIAIWVLFIYGISYSITYVLSVVRTLVMGG